MSIASEKVKLATERFLLVRINPARFVEPVFVSGSLYEMAFPYPVNRLERNGVALTKVTTVSNDDEWSYDESTGILSVQLADPPDDSTNILIAYYYLFYTGTITRSISEDPEDPLTTTREWEPRILQYPVISQSFENIINGVFTISDTSIEIINTAGEFQRFLTVNDSFNNKDVEIWMCINNAQNIQKIFTGTVSAISCSQNTVVLSLLDRFNTLKQPAFMGDTTDEAIFRRNPSSYPALDPKQNGKPNPYIVGSTSRYQTAGQPDMPAGGPPAYLLSVGTEGVCLDYSADVSDTTNRIWGLGRIKGNLQDQSFGTILDTLDTMAGYRFIKFDSISNVFIGDTFSWNELGTDYYAVVNFVGDFTYLGNDYNLVISDPTGPFTLSSTVSSLKSIGVFIEAPNSVQTYAVPRQIRDYTTSELTTSDGNRFIKIEFTVGFESNFPDLGFLAPDAMQVFYRLSNTVVFSHADILEEILGKVGLPILASTFTAAEGALPVNARFHIPNFDEDAADNYLKYVQDVLSSTLGTLKINSSFEVEYHLLEAPVSNDLRDSFLMLDSGTFCEIDYADIVTKIIAFNPHNDSGDAVDDVNTPAATAESLKARYLHGLVNVDRFRHVLEELTTKIQDHINLKSMRKAKYTFETATQDIDSELGSDLEIDNKIVLGGGTQDVKIVTIEKAPAKIKVQALDLKGL